MRKSLKVLVVNDSGTIIENIIDVAKSHDMKDLHIIGIIRLGDEAVYAAYGEEPASLEEAMKGADVVLLDHDMPVPGKEFLAEMRKTGLSAETRVVGTSFHEQPYVSEQMSGMTLMCPDRWREALDL